MVVAEEYALKYDKHREGYIVLCWQQRICPDCHAPLSGYDRRRRRAIDLEGATRSYYLCRLRCAGCGKLHTEIPVFLLPHKHYTQAAVAEGLKDGPICCPADSSTIRRWKKQIPTRFAFSRPAPFGMLCADAMKALHTQQEEMSMKKLICWVLALTMVVACVLPVAAADAEPGEGTPAPTVVSSAAELLEAIEDAEDGDTICIGEGGTLCCRVLSGQGAYGQQLRCPRL